MKHLLFPALTLCLFTTAFAQSAAPAYVLFSTNCMQQLEYKYTRTGASLYAYSVQPNADEQYVFFSGSSGMPTAELPVGTFDCSNLRLNDEVVKIINEQAATRQLYIILQQPTSGYLMMPIYSATQIKRYGPWYLLVGQKYTFAIDTTRLSYQDNLQGETSPTVIRFAGSQLANCRYQWRFHGEPARGFSEKTDFEFIYGVGIINSRAGANAADLEQSEFRLNTINGVPLNTYLATICPYTDQVTNNQTSNWTNPPNYGTAEPDKEYSNANANTNWNNQGAANNAVSNPFNCPTPPGKGYHVVQRGESLKAIARTYNVDLKSVIKWNNIKNPDHIEVCQQIWLQKPPTGTQSVAPTSKGDAQYTPNGPTVQNQSVYWNGNQNTTLAPNQYNYGANAANTVTVRRHTVQRGESLYSISKKYVCPEECVRRANNFPLTGNVVINVGQTIIIPDCSCQTPGYNAPRTPTTTNNPPPAVNNVLNPQTYNTTPTQPDAPVGYGNYQNPAVTTTKSPNATDNTVANPTTDPNNLPPTQEYIVRQGETMNSIAIKHKMAVSELAALNNIPQDEKLVAGRRLVVRKY